jgi:hypothetical protein
MMQAVSLMMLSVVASAQPSTDNVVEAARTVRAAIVRAAAENAKLPARERRHSDDLTVYYVRAATGAARKLPPDRAGPGCLLALAVCLDSSDLLRKNPVSGPTWKRVESDDERKDRLRVLGEPTIHGRHDLCQHFMVSGGLTALHGARAAEAAGILKEMLDSDGGSGFSFADLAADLSGIAFAEMVLRGPEALTDVEKRFVVKDFAVSPRGLIEGLTKAQFEEKYGSVSDPRFRKELADLKTQVRSLAKKPGS